MNVKKMTSVLAKFKSLLLTLLIFFLIIIVPILSVAEEDTGSIRIDLKTQSGDRLDTYQTVLKIFQDDDENPYVVVEFPEINPILIDSLPLGYKYKVEVYVNGMLSATTKIVVDGEKELTMHVPAQGGMRFVILYDDGETPIEGAKLSIKSNDGYLWQQDIVGIDGKSKRFWMQSNNLIDSYYIAEVLVDQSLAYTSPERIKFFPDFQGDIKIKTPWPKIVDDLITVSVYKDTSQKVTKSDGRFVVELYNSKNNKVAQSSVNHRGEAFFSNLKVGQYSFKAIKQPSDTISEAQVFAVANAIITGKESAIAIFAQESVTQGPQKTCNCVAFRLDDVQDYYLNTPQIEVMKLFQKKGAHLTLGIIGGFWGQDQKMLDFIKEDLNRPVQTFEIGSHGWNNSPLTNFGKNDQLELLQKTNKIIQDTLGVTPTTFTAVKNLFNNDTTTVLRELGFTHFTAHIEETHSPPYALENSDLYYLPASTQTAIINWDTNLWENIDHEVTYAEARDFLREYGFAVVMMHPYEFSETDLGVYTGEANFQPIDDLGKLIDQLRDDGIEIVSIGQITGKATAVDITVDKDTASELDLPQTKLQSCNCVAFRLVTIQDYWLNDVQIEVIDTFIRNKASLTIGLIGNLFGDDAKLSDYLKNAIEKNENLEIANNGWSYEVFSDFTEKEQSALLRQSNDHIASIFGKPPSVFIPPYEIFNDDTVLALNENYMSYISSNIQNDPPPYSLDSDIYHFPGGATTGRYNLEFNLIEGVDHKETFAEIQETLNNNGFAVVTLSPQEFSKTENRNYVNQVNEQQIHELELLLEKIQAQGLKIVPIGKMDLSFTDISIPGWIKNNAGWWAEGAIEDPDFVLGIQYLIKEGIMKIPPTSQETGSGSDEIPSWIKNNAGRWADGLISDSDFISGIQWLITNGIIKISSSQPNQILG